ncbi:MAG: energy transducer TonB [bacterium]|nr:energy transducer TonB [bacterium]
MPRTLVALTIALALHGLLLVANLSLTREKPIRPPVPRVVTVTLGYRQPEKPVLEKPEIPPVAPRQIDPPPQKPEKKEPPKKEKIRRPAPEPIPETPPQPEVLNSTSEPLSPPPEAVEELDRGAEREVTTVIEEAKPLYRMNRPPPYPRLARKQGYAGTVVLEVLVDRQGRVGDLRVLSSSGYALLDKAATAAVKGWRFEPGRRGAEAVDMWVRVPIRFVLE